MGRFTFFQARLLPPAPILLFSKQGYFLPPPFYFFPSKATSSRPHFRDLGLFWGSFLFFFIIFGLKSPISGPDGPSTRLFWPQRALWAGPIMPGDGPYGASGPGPSPSCAHTLLMCVRGYAPHTHSKSVCLLATSRPKADEWRIFVDIFFKITKCGTKIAPLGAILVHYVIIIAPLGAIIIIHSLKLPLWG